MISWWEINYLDLVGQVSREGKGLDDDDIEVLGLDNGEDTRWFSS